MFPVPSLHRYICRSLNLALKAFEQMGKSVIVVSDQSAKFFAKFHQVFPLTAVSVQHVSADSNQKFVAQASRSIDDGS
jgi:hypothetical protein